MEKHPLVPSAGQCGSHPEAAALVEAILAEFPKEMPRRFWLSDSIFADNWGKNRDGCFEESWQDWTEIEDWQIAQASSCPSCFLEEDEYAYLLPRNMVWVVREMTDACQSNGIGEYSFLWWLSPMIESGGLAKWLTPKQIGVVGQFLEFASRDEDYREALNSDVSYVSKGWRCVKQGSEFGEAAIGKQEQAQQIREDCAALATQLKNLFHG